MKKSIFLLLISVFVLASCGGKDEATAPITDQAPVSWESQAPQVPSPTSPETNSIDGEAMGQDEFTGKIADLMWKWGQLTCDLTSTQTGSEFTGKISIDGKKMKSIMDMTIEWKNVQMQMLVLDDYSYNWDINTKMGMKMKNSPEEEKTQTGEINDEPKNEMDNEVFKFNCKKWIDGVSFDVPQDIQFQDLSDLQNMMPPNMQGQ